MTWNNNFREMSDEDLFKQIEKVDLEGANLARPALYAEIMAIQGELNRRSSERQFKSTQKGMWVSITIATISIIITLVIGFLSFYSSNQWQNEQLPQLKAINSNTKAFLDFLHK